MQKIIHKYCLEEESNGLLLIDMPTGSGKTHNVIDFIYNNYKKSRNKIFFITPLKKNLNYDALKDRFLKDNRKIEFDENVVYIKSNMDMLLENFTNVYNSIPEKIKLDNVTKHIKTLEGIINSNIAVEFKAEAKKSLREEFEPKFRSILEKFVAYDDKGKKRDYDERLKFIKDNNQWIEVLYPSVKTNASKIIFMTVDKFLSMNSTIVKPSYTILNDSIVEGSTIFMDEFDSAKENILNAIIQDSLNSKIGLLDLFRQIDAGLNICDFTEKLMTPSKYTKQKKDEGRKYYFPNEIIKIFKKRLSELKSKYNLQYLYKLEGNPKNDAYFLFQDYRFISVLPDGNNSLVVKSSSDEKINKIYPTTNNYNSDELKSVLSEIKSFVNYFQVGIGYIANNYRHLKIELKEDMNLISDDSCVKTVLAEFGIEGIYLNYLTKSIVRRKKNKSISSDKLFDDLDFSCNEKGFSYYSIIDSDSFDTQSKVYYIAVDDSPEKILIGLCNKAKVIGISASSNLRTNTGNFDIRYLEIKLGTKFKHLTKEERQHLKNYFSKQIEGYRRDQIITEKIDISEINIDKIIGSYSKNIQNKLEKYFKNLDNHKKIRYLKLFQCMKNFLSKDEIYSFLFLTSKLLKDQDSNFNFKFAQDVFNDLKQELNKVAYFYSIYGDLDSYETKKADIEMLLSKGAKVFVASSYQTLGAGQNIQYKIPADFKKNRDYFSINSSDYQDEYKDFDAIYVDRPTNVFVNMNNSVVEDSQFIKFLYQVKQLEDSGELQNAEWDAYKYIKRGFETFYNLRHWFFPTPKNSINLKLNTSKIIQQAIGRICRTKNKSKYIFIYYDALLKEDLKGVKRHYKHILLNPEFEKLLDNFNNDGTPNIHQEFNHKAQVIQNQSKAYIGKLLAFKDDSPYKWEQLRELVLKHPTIDIPTEVYSAYIELPKNNNIYFFNAGKKDFSFVENIGEMIGEDYTDLKALLEIPEVKEFFIQKEYATTFEKKKYILSPCMFNDIYKGALGEVVGEFILESKLNISLSKIKNNEKYEKFDFYKNNSYVDFKNFTGFKDLDRKNMLQHIKEKLQECNGKKALIINILKPEGVDPEIFKNQDDNIVIIPYLYDLITKQYNWNGLFEIQKYLSN